MVNDEIRQLEKNMEYLAHHLLNGTAKMEGCLREVEGICRDMRTAVRVFRNGLPEGGKDDESDEESDP